MTPTCDAERRGGSRVAFEKQVQVLPLGTQHTIWARAANLSEHGIFVSSSRLFGVGTTIGVRLPLAGEGRVSLRGRVVRVSGGARPGMGIAFEELDEHESEALRRAVGLAQPIWVREAKVWFAGTAQPTRVQARLGVDGLRLFCDLGFLRLGVPVTLFFPDDESHSYTGLLQSASLHTDGEQGVPRLELAMALDGELPDAAQTWTYWPPPPVATPISAGESLTAAVVEATELVELTAEAEVVVEASEVGEEIYIEAAPPEPGEQVYPLTRASTASGSIEARALPSPALPSEPSVQPSASLVPDPAPGAAALRAEWDVSGVPAAENSQWTLRMDEAPALPRKRRWKRAGFWMWLVALCMAGLTVASMNYTNLWQRVGDKLLTAPPQPHLGTLLPLDVVPAAALPAVLPADDEPAAGVTVEPESAEPAEPASPGAAPPEEAAPAAAAGPASAPASALQPDGTTLIIPIEGSLSEAHRYVLASPDGVAVNLPHARPKVRFGDYRVQRGGFKTIWVRRRPQGGLHLRVLHEPGSVAEVKLTPTAVQVTLKRGSQPEN
jgi:hypothetical protein